MPTPTKGPRFGGSPAHERLILANLAQSLFEHGKITTTVAKAKRVRPVAEKLITSAKRGTLHARRQVLKSLRDKDVVHKLFAEIGPSFATREGGYTRITKTMPRKGDNAPMAVIELITEESVSSAASRVARTAASKQTAKKTPAAEKPATEDSAAQKPASEEPATEKTTADEAAAEPTEVDESSSSDEGADDSSDAVADDGAGAQADDGAGAQADDGAGAQADDGAGAQADDGADAQADDGADAQADDSATEDGPIEDIAAEEK